MKNSVLKGLRCFTQCEFNSAQVSLEDEYVRIYMILLDLDFTQQVGSVTALLCLMKIDGKTLCLRK
jgi:hypothetical protein